LHGRPYCISPENRVLCNVIEKDWKIRAATPEDAPQLARLRYAFRTERRPAKELEAEFLSRCSGWMRERLAPGARWRCWVALVEERLAGTLWLQLIEKLPNPGDEAELHGYISSVYVAPPLRNRGVGTELLKACLNACDGLEIDAVFLWSTADSRRFYQRHGFAVRDDLLDRRG
jgi:GNAT superfamily N-acetyltransferase